jgi:dTDP-4-dehydrorhamnose reductase
MSQAPLKILVTGRNGQVSQELQKVFAGQAELLVLGSAELDLSQPQHIADTVRALRPDLIINPAAHTAVDQAESEEALAMAINAEAPKALAQVAAELDIPLIHYSTDYVFDGSKAGPYQDDDATHPLGVYGASKLAGEEAIRAVGGKYLILRTSWVYSSHGRNFLLTMQRLLQEKPHMRIVADQIGAPTWAGTIAGITAQLVQHWRAGKPGAWGTYHLTGTGETSWFGFAEEIGRHLKAQGMPCAELEPIPSSAYPTPAARPLNSRLDCSRLEREWNVRLPEWRDALNECLAQQA